MAILAKWWNVRLWTKWFWVWVSLDSFNIQISHLFEQGVLWHSGNLRLQIHSKNVCDMIKTHKYKFEFSVAINIFYPFTCNIKNFAKFQMKLCSISFCFTVFLFCDKVSLYCCNRALWLASPEAIVFKSKLSHFFFVDSH